MPEFTLAAFFGLAFVALQVYRSYGHFHSVFVWTAILSAEKFIIGVLLGIFVAFVSRRAAKIVLPTSAALLIGVDLIVIGHHSLRYVLNNLYSFSKLNALLLGILLAVSLMLRFAPKRMADEEVDLEDHESQS